MPITGTDWEMHIVRKSEQKSGARCRTVGAYKVFHDGVAVAGLSGAVAETRGPGDNSTPRNKRRIEAGRYPLSTQLGPRYVTIGFTASLNRAAVPSPGLELNKTGRRTKILIHPGRGFLSSVGCINPATSLPDADENIEFVGSRKRTIALIEDLKASLGDSFPSRNGKKIPKAFVVIEGEP